METVRYQITGVERVEEAIAHYQRALELQPDLPTAHYNLAVAFLRQKRWDDAIPHLQAALRIDPNYPDANYFLNEALSEQRQR